METKKYRMGPATRLEIGAVVLEAAQHVETTLVRGRLNAFAVVQRSYAGAQRKVAAVEDQLRQLQAQLAQCDLDQGEAVEGMARALVSDGQPRANPFDALGTAAPSLLRKLPVAEEAKAIHQLVAAVQRSKTVSQATHDAVRAVEKAAQAVEAALAQQDKVEAALQKARRRRDTIGERWDSTLASLKWRTRSAADEGAPDLYAALFGRLVWSKSKKKTPAPAPAPAAVTPAPAPPQATAA